MLSTQSRTDAVLCTTTMPLFTGLIGMAVERHRPAGRWLAGAGVAVLGAAAFVLSHGARARTHGAGFGDLLILCATLSVASTRWGSWCVL